MAEPKKPLTQQVDDYLILCREIDELEAKKKLQAEAFKALGPCVIRGGVGAVEITAVVGRQTTDWKSVKIAVNIPDAVIAKYTKTGADSTRISTTYF